MYATKSFNCTPLSSGFLSNVSVLNSSSTNCSGFSFIRAPPLEDIVGVFAGPLCYLHHRSAARVSPPLADLSRGLETWVVVVGDHRQEFDSGEDGELRQLRRRPRRPHGAETHHHRRQGCFDRFAEMQPGLHLVVARQANDPQSPSPAERFRLADLAALMDVSPGDPAGALAGERVGQNADNRAEPLAVEFVKGFAVVRLPEAGPLAPAERLDISQPPPDRPVAHVDAAGVAQIDLTGRVRDRLQAGDDLRRAHRVAGGFRRFLLAPFRLARFSRPDFLRRRLAPLRRSGVLADQHSHRVDERAAAQVHFERNRVAAKFASAAAADIEAGHDPETVDAAADGTGSFVLLP